MRKFRWPFLVATAFLLSACGGGGGGEGPALPPPVSTGTTVQGPSGAQAAIPLGAAPLNTQIAITQSSAGAPSLPSGSTALGPMFAFTPHGTNFSAPVTVTVPFDPSLLPSGAAPSLYKTNADHTQWELVAGSTVSGSSISGPVSSFSWFVAALPPPVQVTDEPARFWEFSRIYADREVEQIKGNYGLGIPVPPGVLHENQDFGLLAFAIDGDSIAHGEIYSSESGRTYWVETEAPIPDVPLTMDWHANVVGGESRLLQKQSYRKNAPDATLDLLITDARFTAADFNGTLPRTYVCPWEVGTAANHARCMDILQGLIEMRVQTFEGAEGDGRNHRDVYELIDSTLRFEGYTNNFIFTVSADAEDPGTYLGAFEGKAKPLFRESQFVRTDADMTEIALREPVRVRLDLSKIPLFSEFTLQTAVLARANNRRRGESHIKARLRDPVSTGGVSVEFTGLTPTNRPVLSPFTVTPPPEPVCASATDPEAGTLHFSAESGLIHEFGAVTPPLYLTRTGGSRGTVVATVEAHEDSAIPGTHFVAMRQQFVFDDGDDVPRAIKLTPIDNDTADGDRVVTLSLTAADGCAAVSRPAKAEIIIIDDEARPEVASFSVGGAVTGLTGTGLVLEEITTGRRVTPANGAFTFNYEYADGANYDVRIVTQPTNPIQTCTVTNASGTIAGESVSNVAIACTTSLPNGSLDPTFGSAGKVTAALTGDAHAVALQSDGKIIVLADRSLHRYTSDGSVDKSFGTNGQVAVLFTGSFDLAQDVAVQADGKIVVAGHSRVGTQEDFAAIRYDSDGEIDLTFGTGGKTYVDFNGFVDRAYEVEIQSDGAIVLAGHGGNNIGSGITNDFAVARLTANGALDPTFGSGGRATANIAGATDLGAAATLQADGSIVVVGRAGVSGGAVADVGVVRFTSAGVLDASFGTGGIVRIDYGKGGSDEATGVAMQSDGKIVLVGYARVGATADFLIARLNADGSRDNTFGTSGATTLAFDSQQDAAQAVAVQTDGGILVVGGASSSTVADMGIARFLSDGTLDASFGGTGTLSIDFFGAADDAEALVIQPDGKVIVAGGARNGTSNGLAVIRIAP